MIHEEIPGSINFDATTFTDTLNGEEPETEQEDIPFDAPEMPGRQTRPGKIAKALTKYYGLIGIAVFPRCQPCGTTILENAENCAMALENLARENAVVRQVLNKLTETSAIAEVIAVHAPIVVAITTHHIGPAVAKAKEKRDHQHVEEVQVPYNPPRDYVNRTPTENIYPGEYDHLDDLSVPTYQVPDDAVIN